MQSHTSNSTLFQPEVNILFHWENYFANRMKFFVCFLLGNSPESEFYVPTFRNTSIFLGS